MDDRDDLPTYSWKAFVIAEVVAWSAIVGVLAVLGPDTPNFPLVALGGGLLGASFSYWVHRRAHRP
jgi:hypothetical protein